ncbi:MAG: hypothetical protein FWF06_04465 [Symbiobacteriaceae bacterium]|nr:hypothetical protein [Symbiobacteriaceae bacterium]
MAGVQVPIGIVNALNPLSPWIGVLVTLGVWSFLYKENPVFRICEHAYVGSAAAHTMVTTFANNIKPGLVVDIAQNGEYWRIIPILLGCMIYFQPFRGYTWVSRYPMSFWVGYNAGYNLTLRVAMPLLTEVRRTMLPIFVTNNGRFDLATSINNFIFTGVVTLTLAYFLFSMNVFKGRAGFMIRTARLVLMAAFGAGFGTGIANYVSLLIGRFDFIMSDVLKLF